MVTAAHCLYDGSNQLTVKGGAKFRVMVGEHDHCKHNEVRTSWEKQTNKQNKRQKKQQPSDGWQARPLQAQRGENITKQQMTNKRQTNINKKDIWPK